MAGETQTDRRGGLAEVGHPSGGGSAELSLRGLEQRTGVAQPHQQEPSYYDISILKASVWKWEIAAYFYLGGLSTGAYLLGRVAKRFGGEAHRDLARVSSYIAMAALIPSPPLLIHDLGDPKRFHHMLRVWKPTSPMNLGTWAITGYSGMVTFEVVRQYLEDRRGDLSPKQRGTLENVMNNGAVLLVHDALGIPFALLVAGYTGVLLSCTANPLWVKNTWLGPLFSASAIATGAEAINLALSMSGRKAEASQHALDIVDSVAHAAELTSLQRYENSTGERGEVLKTGSMRHWHRLASSAIIAAEVVKWLPLKGRAKKTQRVTASVLGLVGGFAMRWAIVHGGHEAASDPHTARLSSRPEPDTEIA